MFGDCICVICGIGSWLSVVPGKGKNARADDSAQNQKTIPKIKVRSFFRCLLRRHWRQTLIRANPFNSSEFSARIFEFRLSETVGAKTSFCLIRFSRLARHWQRESAAASDFLWRTIARRPLSFAAGAAARLSFPVRRIFSPPAKITFTAQLVAVAVDLSPRRANKLHGGRCWRSKSVLAQLGNRQCGA